ncbi:MAG TPA: excinuclease ABC subunit A, partial [Candidatus Avibacteroides excrementipullorum]|nr:excinuclease ABC subunit A [Candidatus Avibacteroides excrementipullorum]
MNGSSIMIKGARVNNLKDIDISIPRDKFIVITGISGSGKSSLAFDTLYAEGQRRYVESLSAYARQFLGKMKKPECDYIKGIPPAIAIEQKVTTRNPRSTVGTSTEIYDYLRMLFARIGKTYSPVSGRIVKKQTVEDAVDYVQSFPDGTRFMIEIRLDTACGNIADRLKEYSKQGFSRVDADGRILRIDGGMDDISLNGEIFLVIDRLSCAGDSDSLSRLRDSLETAFDEGDGICTLVMYQDESIEKRTFSVRFEEDGIMFEEPTDLMFSFNSPYGACPECEGFGKVIGIDEHLVVPNTALSVYDGAVVCWRGDKMSMWKNEFIHAASSVDFPVFSPYYELTKEQKDILWHGAPGIPCIDDFFRMLTENQYKVQYRVMLARYRGKTICPSCKGNRLKKEAGYVKIEGKNIFDLVNMSVEDLYCF